MQRAILEVRTGRSSGAKAVLAKDDRIRVGRVDRADLVVSDAKMSTIHFEVAWDGERCSIRDLDSAGGTLIGGQRVKHGEVGHGGWIRAGATDFTLHLEGATPPPLDPDSYWDDDEDDEVEPQRAAWLRENREPRRLSALALAARRERAMRELTLAAPRYAVLDAARSPRIRVILAEAVERSQSLYEGIEGDFLAHVAPYLVEVSPGSRLFTQLIQEGWEQRWGIFIDAPCSFKEMRRHFRRLLLVGDAESNQSYYFRFYDPIILGSFLPESTVKQRSEIFGEVLAYFAENEAGDVLRFNAGGAEG
jgi:hypothetical protein